MTATHPNAPYVANVIAAWAARVAMDHPRGVPDMVAVGAFVTALHQGETTEIVDTPDDVAQAVRFLLGPDASSLDAIEYDHTGVRVDRIPLYRT